MAITILCTICVSAGVIAFIAGIMLGKGSMIIGRPWVTDSGRTIKIPFDGKVCEINNHSLGFILEQVDDSVSYYDDEKDHVHYQISWSDSNGRGRPTSFFSHMSPIEYVMHNSDDEALLQKIVKEYQSKAVIQR